MGSSVYTQSISCVSWQADGLKDSNVALHLKKSEHSIDSLMRDFGESRALTNSFWLSPSQHW